MGGISYSGSHQFHFDNIIRLLTTYQSHGQSDDGDDDGQNEKIRQKEVIIFWQTIVCIRTYGFAYRGSGFVSVVLILLGFFFASPKLNGSYLVPFGNLVSSQR